MISSRRFLGPAMCCPVFLTTVGCSSFSPPKIAVDSVMVTGTTDDAVAVSFELLMTNSNDEPVELIEFEYTLVVDGRSVYSGRRDAQSTVPAGGTWTLQVPAVIPFSDVSWSAAAMPDAAAYELNGALLYISPGALAEVLMDAGVYRPTTSFGARGSLSLE